MAMLTIVEVIVLERQLPPSLRNMGALEELWLCTSYALSRSIELDIY